MYKKILSHLLDIAVLSNFFVFCKKLSSGTNKAKVDVLTRKKIFFLREKNELMRELMLRNLFLFKKKILLARNSVDLFFTCLPE
jgi:hypothetical protein